MNMTYPTENGILTKSLDPIELRIRDFHNPSKYFDGFKWKNGKCCDDDYVVVEFNNGVIRKPIFQGYLKSFKHMHNVKKI